MDSPERTKLLKEWWDPDTTPERKAQVQQELERLMAQERKRKHENDCQCATCTHSDI